MPHEYRLNGENGWICHVESWCSPEIKKVSARFRFIISALMRKFTVTNQETHGQEELNFCIFITFCLENQMIQISF